MLCLIDKLRYGLLQFFEKYILLAWELPLIKRKGGLKSPDIGSFQTISPLCKRKNDINSVLK